MWSVFFGKMCGLFPVVSYVYCVVFGKKCGLFSVVNYVYCVVFGKMCGQFCDELCGLLVRCVDCFLWYVMWTVLCSVECVDFFLW